MSNPQQQENKGIATIMCASQEAKLNKKNASHLGHVTVHLLCSNGHSAHTGLILDRLSDTSTELTIV
jgi:hypothetical protein